MSIVVGIDPGPRESAVVVWNGSAVVSSDDRTNDTMREFLWDYGSIACEWIESFGMPVGQSIFQTVFAIGGFAQHARLRLIPRRDVKLHLCGSPRAKDGNIRQALIDRFGPVGTKKSPGPLFGISSHRWAALAVAVTAHDLERTEHEAMFHVGETVA
ncbi:MAG: hypothetical protein RLZZ21_1369 [Planctomycetota bacterium]|jgi:hypothetical protein